MENDKFNCYLQDCLKMEYHNLLCYSANLLMTIPKAEYEAEWHKAQENINVILAYLYLEGADQ